FLTQYSSSLQSYRLKVLVMQDFHLFGESYSKEEDENLWIASRMVWFDQSRPPDSSQTAPVKIGPSS
ncbi:hypothetical protein STEG23_013421, partial [Scotinomys teguina]